MTTTDPATHDLVDAYPLTALQAGMLFHSEYESGAPTYHDLTTIRLRGRLDHGAFAAALADLTAGHPVLRTSFDLAGFSEPIQLVHRFAAVALEVEDLTHLLDPAQVQTRLDGWAQQEKANPFDWSRAPLARIQVHLLPGEAFAFSLSFHHAILDGWSVAALTTELFRRYAGYLAGRPLPVAPADTAMRDLVARERAALAAGPTIDFWSAQVADAPDTRIPRPAGRPPGATRAVEVMSQPVPADQLAQLRAVARSLQVPLRTVLLATHVRVLALLTGSTRVLTGLVTHGRPESEAGDEVLGLFLNTVPLVVDTDAPSWAALVRRLFDAEVALLAHRHYPLFEIQRISGRSPLLDVLFDVRDFHVYRNMPADAGIEILDQTFFEQTDLPLTVSFGRSRDHDGFDLTLSYDRTQLPAGQIEGIRGHYLTALRELAADPGADPRPSRPYLVADSFAIGRWNSTDREYALAPLHELVADQARRTPDAPGVGYDGLWLTYGELWARAASVTARLRAAGTRPGDVVGVCLPRGPELVPALLGVLCAGAAYLPLEPGLPGDRMAYMIAQAGAARVLVVAETAGLVAGAGAIRLDASDEADGPQPPSGGTAPGAVPLDALAYVIFTSGSTGRPKGVAISHRAIVNRLRWMQQALGLTGADRVLHKTPIGFDVSVWELFWPLMTGAGLVVARPDGHRDSAYLARLISAERITTIHFVPSMLDIFLDEPLLPHQNSPAASALRRVICSGEALPAELAERLRQRWPGVQLHNLYGPTEAAVDVSWHACVPGEAVVPIGHPIANTRLEILDGRGERVPVGTPGELCIGGVQLAQGYLRQPSLTAQRFVPDPHGPAGARLYRTGDVARWLPAGEIEYLGRTDFQVKIRGQRVELGEIEARLAAQPEIRAAVVTVRRDTLVGYLVADVSSEGVDFAARLRADLPDYMVPAVWVRLDALPVTANGKLDRAALPDPGVTGRAPYVPPRDAFEARVATLWEQTLGQSAVGVHDDFFALGGHSLLALRLAMKLRKELGREIPVSLVLTAPTVALLAAELRRPQDSEAAPERIVSLRPGGERTPIFFCHALGGQVFRYLPVTRHLGPDQPVYAIEARGLAPGEEPHATLAEMVEDYVANLLDIRPHGPYVLGGFCIGGNIALEVARRLRTLGHRVPLVVLFYSDADEPVVRSSLSDDASLLLHALAGGPVEIDLDELRRLEPDAQLLAVIEAAATADRLPPETADLAQARRFVSVFRANAHAVGYHRHEPYDGDVVLFSPAPDGQAPADLGWRAVVTGRLRVSPILGRSFAVLYEPLVADAAAELRSCMDHGVADN